LAFRPPFFIDSKNSSDLVRRQPLVQSVEPVMPKMSKSAAMLCIAKAHALDGKPTDIPKRDWYLEIMERSGGSPSQFGKYIQTEDGKTLFAMYKSAKGKDYQGPQDDPDKEDDEDDDDPVNDPAYEKLADAARNLMKSNPTLSFPSAFAKAVNLHPALMKASTAVHRARIAKSYEPKPTVPRGEMGVQHPGLDQYRSRAPPIDWRTRFNCSDLFQTVPRQSQLVPGPDDNKGKDKSVVLMKPEKQTEQRMRTSKTYNANQRPMALPGDEGFSFWKA
jgi:hypothetical protein